MLGTVWRIPFGCGALLAGWLADRYGSKPLLLIFLGGCVLTSLLSFWAPTLNIVFLAMFAMGCFASIYHPAGLALISRETGAENRPAALGWHGILGSLGFTGAPLLAALAFSFGSLSWRQYYVLLCVPAAVLAILLAVTLRESRPAAARLPSNSSEDRNAAATIAPSAIPGVFYHAGRGGSAVGICLCRVYALPAKVFEHGLCRVRPRLPPRVCGISWRQSCWPSP